MGNSRYGGGLQTTMSAETPRPINDLFSVVTRSQQLADGAFSRHLQVGTALALRKVHGFDHRGRALTPNVLLEKTMQKTPWTRLTLLSFVILSFFSLPVLGAGGPGCDEDESTLLARGLGDSSFPHLDFGSGAPVYRAAVDLRKIDLPLISVSNPSADAPVTVEILARSARASVVRSHLIQIEPLGTSTISLELGQRLTDLSALSYGAFEMELSSARSDRTFPVSVVADAHKLGPDDCDGGPGGGSSCQTKCSKNWTLTCKVGGTCGGNGDPAGDFGPVTYAGRVECASSGSSQADRVYWNLNTPTGAWTTVGISNYTATWSQINGDGCPTEVTNSAGHTYNITF